MSIITGGSRTVYYGPNASRYASEKTLSSGTPVTALSKEEYKIYSESGNATSETWIFIEWTDGTKRRRGYVKSDWISVSESIKPVNPYANALTGARWGINVGTTHTLYCGPDSNSTSTNTQYAEAGSISAKEQVTFLGDKVNGWAFIEYNLAGSGLLKRAYINANNLAANISAVSVASPGIRYTEGQFLPGYGPYGGTVVNQGFDDDKTIHKGHLGFDLNVPGNFVKPLFEGTFVDCGPTNGNGNVVVIKHIVHGETFYTTYSHMASYERYPIDQKVFPTTIIGIEGNTGGVRKHLHISLYTGRSQTNPYGYCASDKVTPFSQAVKQGGSTKGYYYGPNDPPYPRCGGVRFYDPYRVYTSGAAIITAMKDLA